MAETIIELGGKKVKFPDEASAQKALAAWNAIPENVRNLASGLLDYRVPLPSGMALGRPNSPWNAAASVAAKIDPSWNAMEYPTRADSMKKFRSGPDAEAIRSFNTGISHMGRLYDQVKALDNSEAGPLVNAPLNFLAEKASFINPKRAQAEARFNTDLTALASELTRAFRLSGGAEKDVQDWRNNFSVNAAPSVQRAAMQEAIVNLLGPRIAAQREKFKRGMGNANVKMPFWTKTPSRS